MTISVNYNPSVLKTQRNLSNASKALNLALERMSTGLKVNCAADDAAGYTVIKTAADLDNIRNNMSGKYMLMNDIDLSGFANWDPIGDGSNKFSGTFDGNGFVISNLTINRPGEEYNALFGFTDNATIKNAGMEDVNINGRAFSASLVGRLAFKSSITNCYASGNINGTEYTAGLAGYSYNSTTSNSYFSGNVTGTNETGGIVGSNSFDSKITNCYASGSVSGIATIGGIVGYNYNSSITNSYTNVIVSGNHNIGGLIGLNNLNSSIMNCFWDSDKSSIPGIALNEQPDPSKVIVQGLTSFEMNESEYFINAGWSTSDWRFYEGYPPKLAWEPTPPPPGVPLRLQVGANSDSNSAIFVETDFKIGSLKINLMTLESSVKRITAIDKLLERVNQKISDFGAVLNRLDSVLSSQTTQIENLTASKSTIMDADIAEESANYTRNQILQQTSSALLVQSQSLHKNIILGLIGN